MIRTLILALAGVAAPLMAATPEPTPSAAAARATPAATERDWFSMEPEAFAATPEARSVINFQAFRHDVLSAALFHETNRKRQGEGLPPLKHDERARRAAALQAKAMAEHGILSHENRARGMRTLDDRVLGVGLKPRRAAENVAFEFALEYESGKPFYTRELGGKTVFSYTPDGPPLKMHTYQEFAEKLLGQWMESPGHRQNILRPEMTHMGCDGYPAREAAGMEVIYCVQVFFVPL